MKKIDKLFTLFEKVMKRKMDVRSYDDRLSLQKLAYIFKSAGIDYGYSFNWYVRGPYSPPLASDAYDYDISPRDVSLKPIENKVAVQLNDTFKKDISNSGKLELIASLLFLKKERNLSLNQKDELVSALKSLKPWFTEKEIRAAIEKISSSKLFE